MNKPKTKSIEITYIERVILHDALILYLNECSGQNMDEFKITTTLDIFKKLGYNGKDNLKFKAIAALLDDRWDDACMMLREEQDSRANKKYKGRFI